MKTIEADFDKLPDLNLSETGGVITSHRPEIGLVTVSLDDTCTLRINGRPVGLYLHWMQSLHGNTTSLSEIASEMQLRHDLVNAGLAQVLHDHPGLIPPQWFDPLDINGIQNSNAGGGLIFWSTVIENHGKRHFAHLALNCGIPILGAILEDRFVRRRSTPIFIG